MEWAEPLIKVLAQGRDRNAPLFNFSLAELSKEFHAATAVCGLLHPQQCLYGLRRGGASEDHMRRRRSLEDIEAHGRWRSQAAALRYTK